MALFKQAVCEVVGLTYYSQSRQLKEQKKPGEKDPDYEQRCWRSRLHITKTGHVFIPGMQFTNSICEAAKYLSMPIPGDRKKTFTKHFEAGVRCIGDVVLPIKAADVDFDELFVPSNGKRGDGCRVTKFFPKIEAGWKGTVTFIISDPVIDEVHFRKALDASGTLIGIGRFRPRNMGSYGMFEVKSVKWIE